MSLIFCLGFGPQPFPLTAAREPFFISKILSVAVYIYIYIYIYIDIPTMVGYPDVVNPLKIFSQQVVPPNYRLLYKSH